MKIITIGFLLGLCACAAEAQLATTNISITITITVRQMQLLNSDRIAENIKRAAASLPPLNSTNYVAKILQDRAADREQEINAANYQLIQSKFSLLSDANQAQILSIIQSVP